MPPDTNERIYRTALTRACKRALFEIDQRLTGRAEGAHYRLTADQYDEAHYCISRLYAIIRNPQLRASPLGRARADMSFQRFIGQVTSGKLAK